MKAAKIIHSSFTFIACTLLLAVTACVPSSTESQPSLGAPKLILIIGDGMDDQQITIARNYLAGSHGRLTLDAMPFRGTVQVQTVDERDPTRPVYVADSANTATSMATGTITSAGRIATTAGTDEDLVTIMELAQAAGIGTGIVTTSSLTDATPASFIAHVSRRLCQSPTSMVTTFGPLQRRVDCSDDYKANGGPGSIAEQLAASQMNVLLGGGLRHFEPFVEGSAHATVLDAAAENGFTVILERDALTELSRNTKTLGLFAPNTMPVRLRGTEAAQARLVEKIDGRVQLPEPFTCEANPEFEGMPTLAQMTQAALRQLDTGRGFVLMVESASIDKQSHLRRPCGSIGEMEQLDQALEIAIEYAEAHRETLVLVTADHSHAAQIVADEGAFLGLDHASPGYFARVLTPEGSIMGINYATNDSPIQEYHTGAQIPLYAFGAGAKSLPAFVHQAEIFDLMTRHLGLTAQQ